MTFIGILIKENSTSLPYELLLRLEDIISIDERSITFQVDEDAQDTLLLAEKLDYVVRRLSKAGVAIYR